MTSREFIAANNGLLDQNECGIEVKRVQLSVTTARTAITKYHPQPGGSDRGQPSVMVLEAVRIRACGSTVESPRRRPP